MKKHTNKFGLLIVDDEEKPRRLYSEWLSDHYKLKDTWDSIEEREDAQTALGYIEDYVKTNDHHLLVVADAYMPPNCDGNKILESDKLFGALWLIDKVNGNRDLKACVTVLLVTYYDKQIRPYRNGNINEFPYSDGIDYFFVEKPVTQSDYTVKSEAIEGWERKHKTDERDALYAKTFEAIWKIIDSKRETEVLQRELQNSSALRVPMIGNSEKMEKVYSLIEKIAPTDSNVLITGESGTGKELVARNLHYLNASRKDKSFIAINCSAIPDNLLESELFGHEKGAFTGAASKRIGKFEAANKGTIFLDEVGDMSPATQAKVLRVIREKTFERLSGNESISVDVRIVAATNKDLSEEIKKGTFREDLYFRLNVIPIHMPPLRERKEDIPLLVKHFLEKFCNRINRIVSITDGALNILKEYNWPGNVGEFENIIERLVVLSTGEITSDTVKSTLSQKLIKSRVTFNGIPSLEEVEKELVSFALKQCGNKAKAAKALGLHPTTITNLITKYKIDINSL